MVSSRACPVLHGEPGPAKGNIVVILISTGTRKFIMYTVQRRAQDFFFFLGWGGVIQLRNPTKITKKNPADLF